MCKCVPRWVLTPPTAAVIRQLQSSHSRPADHHAAGHPTDTQQAIKMCSQSYLLNVLSCCCSHYDRHTLFLWFWLSIPVSLLEICNPFGWTEHLVATNIVAYYVSYYVPKSGFWVIWGVFSVFTEPFQTEEQIDYALSEVISTFDKLSLNWQHSPSTVTPNHMDLSCLPRPGQFQGRSPINHAWRMKSGQWPCGIDLCEVNIR